MRLIAYVRVSTDMQADDGHSLVAQEAKIRQYCELYGHEVVCVYREEGGSGKDLAREALNEALVALKGADGLIVAKLDRLTRSVRDFNYLIEGVFRDRELVSVSDSIDTSSAAGRLILNILMSIFQWEREATSERTREVLGYMKGQGMRVGSVPYGMKLASDGKALEEDEEERGVIEDARLLSSEGHSLRTIARALTDLGYKTRKGGAFTAEQIRRML